MSNLHVKTPGPRGFSLVEILVALVLLAIALTSITVMYVGHHRVQDRLAQQWAAQNFLVQEMERLVRSGAISEGREEIEFGEERRAPTGIPETNARLIIEVSRWEDARPEERLQHARITIEWTWHTERRSATLESLVRGPAS